MRLISRKPLRDFWQQHPTAEQPLKAWIAITERAVWHNLAEVKADFPHADLVGICTVFNIHGNDFRLITKISFRGQKVFIRFVLTHPEYDRGRWKND